MEEDKWFDTFGNIKDVNNFDELWNTEKAKEIREHVRHCPKNCWMIGTASPVIKKYPKEPMKWILKNKLRSMQGKAAYLKFCDELNCESCKKEE